MDANQPEPADRQDGRKDADQVQYADACTYTVTSPDACAESEPVTSARPGTYAYTAAGSGSYSGTITVARAVPGSEPRTGPFWRGVYRSQRQRY